MFANMRQVREANKKAGYRFFDRDNVRSRKREFLTGLIWNQYFITLENHPGAGRLYSVQQAKFSGVVRLVKTFRTLQEAKDFIYSGPASSEKNPTTVIPRNKWVKGQIRVTSAGKIQFRKV